MVRALFRSWLALVLLSCSALPALAASPQGLIVFACDRSGRWDIWVMVSDGSSPVNLTSDWVADDYPEFSRDGKKIVWTKGGRGPDGELWVMNADGSGKKQLTSDGYSDIDACWSPDGSQIAWRSQRKGNRDIYVMASDGTNVRRLTADPAADFAPDWSPDGKHIAFTSQRSGDNAIWVMNADGSDQRQLTPNRMHAALPGWSPDGTRIVFADGTCDTCAESDLFWMNADGTHVTQITDTPDNEMARSWATDGKSVVGDFARFVPADKRFAKGDVAVWDVAAGAMTNLTNTDDSEEGRAHWSPEVLSIVLRWGGPKQVSGDTVGPQPRDTVYSSRSADGVATIEYTLPKSGHVRVRVFNTAGHEVARLVDEWQPAGSHFTMFPFGASAKQQVFLYRVECDGRSRSGRIEVAP
jgi:Tol biopolymer transport system component